jgi:hypothetical protein
MSFASRVYGNEAVVPDGLTVGLEGSLRHKSDHLSYNG